MKQAFTLMELLVVIAIVGILSAVVLTSLNGARLSARAAAAIQTLSEIEKAIERECGLNDNCPTNGISSISSLVSSGLVPSLEPFVGAEIGGVPITYTANTNTWVFDNCSGGLNNAGVNLRLSGADSALMNKIDEVVDDGNGMVCGKIRLAAAGVYYWSIATDASNFP